jgi:hypothetical protein
MLQNKTFAPTVEFPSPVLKGIDAMPPLHGYVITTPKPRASLVLNAPPLAEEVAAVEASGAEVVSVVGVQDEWWIIHKPAKESRPASSRGRQTRPAS